MVEASISDRRLLCCPGLIACHQLAYRDLDTLLLQQMRDERGRRWVDIDPIEGLNEQGRSQFELFAASKHHDEPCGGLCCVNT